MSIFLNLSSSGSELQTVGPVSKQANKYNPL